jgi:AcrR family transcriptional regulator
MTLKKPLPQSNKPSDAKTRILLTAHHLFYKEGIRATGVDRLIKESGVSKLTFYRHFASNNNKILACLHYRHERWMAWFTTALKEKGNRLEALNDVLLDWFLKTDYRGCAFINSVGELGTALPEVAQISLAHKQDMTRLIATLIPKNTASDITSNAISLAIDGAIIRVQCGEPAQKVLDSFKFILTAITHEAEK